MNCCDDRDKDVLNAAGSLLLVLVALCGPASGRVIEVGPQREARTLDAAVARAKVGDEIVLERGMEHLTAGVVVRVDAIEIRSADGPGEPATIRNTSTTKYPATIEHRGEGLILKDLILAGVEGRNVTCVRAKGVRLIVDGVKPAASAWRFVALDGAMQTVVRHCDAPILPDYTVCSFGSDNRDLLVERCTFAGSAKEHTIRLHKIRGAVFRDSTFSVGGKKSAFSPRDGADVRVENCTLNGPLGIGPLADGDGGINHPTSTPAERAKREAMLRLSLRNVAFKRCTIDTGGITVEMGVQNLVFDECWIKTSRNWLLRLNRDGYEPWRNVPSGRIVHCELTGPADLRPFERDRPDFHVVGTVINGVRVSDSGSPATHPAGADGGGTSGGGATPGEVTPTPPTTVPNQPIPTPPTLPPSAGARPADVLSALDSVDAALTALQAARHHLHSSTQPSASAR